MDRGVKIAIFVASIMSLGLGLIWDQVLSHARVAVEAAAHDELAPELMDARVGSPDIERLKVPEDANPNFDIKPVKAAPAKTAPEVKHAESKWTGYTVKTGDSWWKLAHVTFKDRGLSSEDVQRANKGKVLRPGETLQIPPGKDALKNGPPPAPKGEHADSKPTPKSSGETEYTVKEGDSWWKIAYIVFKDRKVSTDDLQNANPGVKLVPGAKIKVPAGS